MKWWQNNTHILIQQEIQDRNVHFEFDKGMAEFGFPYP
jgi:hypothetical protein